ncbi:MAG: hypothetical protein QXK06_03915, partial [Candidatus Diapherotrites archaeon]
NFVFVFRVEEQVEEDGEMKTKLFDYQVKSNSWAKGGLAFTAINKAYFTGQCTVQKIDAETGTVVQSFGPYKFLVNITDGDIVSPKTRDSFAVTILDSTNKVWKQLGTSAEPIELGGGNITVHSK